MNRVLKYFLVTLLVLVTALGLAGCGSDGDSKASKNNNKASTTKKLKIPDKRMKFKVDNSDMDNPYNGTIKVQARDAQYVVRLNNANPNYTGIKSGAPKKPTTIMLYMCGTNLETKFGIATEDIREMIASRFDSRKANIVILTGGTKQWHVPGMVSQGCNIYRLEGKQLVRHATLGNNLLSDPRTLTTFINYTMQAFPADKQGLVFWDHGGGPVWSYATDEWAPPGAKSRIDVPDLHQALANSMLAQKKIDFIGFNCCLMATAEAASAVKDFAHYFIGAEESIPGFGWDWRWIRSLSDRPEAPMLEHMKVIAERMAAAFESDGNKFRRSYRGTISIIDLSKMTAVEQSLGNLSRVTHDIFSSQAKAVAYERARKATKSFGQHDDGSSFDMVDIYDYADKLSAMFPAETEAVKKAINEAVVVSHYSKISSYATGLSTYVPMEADISHARASYMGYNELYSRNPAYSSHAQFINRLGKCLAPDKGPVQRRSSAKVPVTKAVPKAFEMSMSPEAEAQVIDTKFVLWRELTPGSDYFVRLLVDKEVTSEKGKYSAKFDGRLWSFQDEFIYLREVDRVDDIVTYDSPAYLNGEKVRVQFIQDKEHPEPYLTGAVYVGDRTKVDAQALAVPVEVKPGDTLQFRYWANLWTKPGSATEGRATHKWVRGKALTVGEDVTLKRKAVGRELYLATFWVTEMDKDLKVFDYYTQKLEMRRK